VTGDDQAELFCKPRLFHQAERLDGIAHTLYVAEGTIEKRFAERRLERIIIYQ
jgi:hypothetical protein